MPRVVKFFAFAAFAVALAALTGPAFAQGGQLGRSKHAAPVPTPQPPPSAPLEIDTPVETSAPPAAEAPAPKPQTMKVGLHLEKLSKFEIGPGTFAAEFYLTFTCAHEPCAPEFELTNGRVNGTPDKVVDQKLLKQYRVKADFEGLVDLSEFPFDKHVLSMGLVDADENVHYDVDPKDSAIDDSVKLAGWNIAPEFIVGSEKQMLEDGREISEAQIGVAIRRPALSAFFKSMVPVFFMVFVAGFTLLLKPKSAAGRLSTATAGLMSVVMFHLASTSSLPPMGYMTRMDKFMIATYIVYLANIAFSVAMVRFEEKKKEVYGEIAYLAAAGAVPGIALIAWAAVFMKLV